MLAGLNESLFVALETVLDRTAFRPVHSLSTPTNVSIKLTVVGILGVEWKTEAVKWDPLQCGTSRISLPRSMLWTPDILINEVMEEDQSPEAPYVYLNYTGHVFDAHPIRVVSACRLDIYAFPFDVQNCSLTFGSYLHVASDLQLTLGRNISEVLEESRSVLRSAGEWELLDLRATDNAPHTRDHPIHHDHDQVVFYIILRRRATLYVVNLLVPSCFLITVDLFSFLLPPQSVDRSSFKMTLILGYTVFLLIMNDLLPITGSRTPLINVFFSICLALMVSSLLETILITNILYSSSQYPSIPRWIRVIVLQYLARLVCLYQKPSNRVTVTLHSAVQAEKYEAAAGPSVISGPQEPQGPQGKGHFHEELLLQELRRLSADLLAIRLKMDRSQQGSQNAEEWVQIGNVIDRLLFCLYLLFICASFLTIIMIWAHWHSQ
ncbi:5-hydroxytryptamine receptor 3A-like [Conger conger]|uniref:5-hydroxytryptamine receptor 3A-like n=1 Tax=Conger conger TaxID=82655 RepID=UPI002A5A878E|nr:5-hydroxytryptamine receptor 3A-like [Conger conger]